MQLPNQEAVLLQELMRVINATHGYLTANDRTIERMDRMIGFLIGLNVFTLVVALTAFYRTIP